MRFSTTEYKIFITNTIWYTRRKWKEIFSQDTQKLINKCIDKTKNNDKLFLTFLLAYDGTDEMIYAINQIKEKNLKPVRTESKNSDYTESVEEGG